jgi:hypothetical protein
VTEEFDHSVHTEGQIDALQRAHQGTHTAIEALTSEDLAEYQNPDVAEAVRLLRTAELWLTDILLSEDHEPETVHGPDAEPPSTPTPLH